MTTARPLLSFPMNRPAKHVRLSAASLLYHQSLDTDKACIEIDTTPKHCHTCRKGQRRSRLFVLLDACDSGNQLRTTPLPQDCRPPVLYCRHVPRIPIQLRSAVGIDVLSDLKVCDRTLLHRSMKHCRREDRPL